LLSRLFGVIFLVSLAAPAAWPNDIYSIPNDQIPSGVITNINRCCGNAENLPLNGQFACPRGEAASGCLIGQVQAMGPQLNQRWQGAMRELTPNMRAYVAQKCGRMRSIPEQYACTDRLFDLSDRRFYDLALEPSYADRDPSNDFNVTAAQRAMRAFRGADYAFSAYALACQFAKGHIVARGEGRNRRLRAQGTPDADCSRQPERTPVSEIPYQPSPPTSSEAANRQSLGSGSAADVARQGSSSSSQAGGGPSRTDILFDAYDGSGLGTSVNCPSFIPREYCGGGGRYDPLHYRPHQEVVSHVHARGESFPVYGTVYRYEQQPTTPLTESIGRHMEGYLPAVKPMLKADIKDFMVEVFMERYLQMATINGTSASMPDRIAQLAQLSSCHAGGAAKARAIAAQVPNPPELDQARAQYKNRMALAAQCLQAAGERWQRLGFDLGILRADGSRMEISRTILKNEEIEQLPVGVRHIVNGLTGFPVVRQLLREAPFMTGEFVEQAGRDCSFLQERMNPTIPVERRNAATGEVERWTAPRMNYCMNVYSEYAILAQEMNSLYNTFPMLGTRMPDGSHGFQRIVRGGGGVNPRIRGYNLDFNRGAGRELMDPGTDGLNYCMARLRQNPSDANGPMIQAPAGAMTAADEVVNQRLNASLEEIGSQIRKLCDPEKADEFVKEAIRSPDYMSQYFRCDRPRFPTLATMLHTPPEQTPRASLSGDACTDRINSSIAACRLFREYEHEDRNEEVMMGLAQVGFDLLAVAVPGVGGFAPSAGRFVVGAALGGGIGFGMSYLMGPTASEQRDTAQFQSASYLAGFAPVERYERATERLAALAERNPHVEALLTGTVMGGVMSQFMPGAGGAARAGGRGGAGSGARGAAEALLGNSGSAARTEAELLSLYYRLKSGGHLAGAEGQALERELIALFDETLRRRYPAIPEVGWRALSLEDRLAILEGRMAAPGTRPPTAPPAVPRADPRPILARPEARQYQQRHRVFTAIDSADNRAFIRAANEARPGEVVFWTENTVLKQLNDTVFDNKPMVTAMSNHYKEILFRRVQANPYLRSRLIGRYSDFKSTGFRFRDAGPELEAQMRQVYDETAREFAQAIDGTPMAELVRGHRGISGDPASWHLAGMGSTVDEAGAAARTARSFHTAGGTRMESFTQVEGLLTERATRVERYRSVLASEIPADSGIMVPARTGSRPLVLSEPAIELLRKVDARDLDGYVAQVQEKFRRRFGVNLSRETVIHMRDYYTMADGFSSGLLQESRTVIDLGSANHGIVSVDFAGQGARNLNETMAGLAEAPGDGRAGVRQARAAEGRATARMQGLGDGFGDAVDGTFGRGQSGRIQFSGDDGIFMPQRALTPEGKVEFVQRVAAVPEGTGLRVTFVPTEYSGGGVIPAGQRSALIQTAENVEKNLRSALEGRVPHEQMRRVMVAVDLVPDAQGGGRVNLILGGNVTPEIADAVRAQVARAIPDNFHFGDLTTAPPRRATVPPPSRQTAPPPGP
jgi:hypothetical protein